MRDLRNNFMVKMLVAPVVFAIVLFSLTCCCISSKAEASPALNQGSMIKNAVKMPCNHCPTSRAGSPIKPCCAKIIPASVELKPLNFAATPQLIQVIALNNSVIKYSATALSYHRLNYSLDHPPDPFQKFASLRL